MVILSRLKEKLSRTRKGLIGNLSQAVRGHKRVDEKLLEQMEEILIRGDVGVETAAKLLDKLRKEFRANAQVGPEQILNMLRGQIEETLNDQGSERWPSSPLAKPYVVLVVGVNGTGKTTSIAKLAKMYLDQGKRVLLAGCDTFRAAANDMEELKKITRVIGKQIYKGPHEILLVLDATVGQNAISQARLFHEALGLTGIFLAKLDGTAKGGIIIAIKDQLRIPVAYIGIGEGLNDLEPFDVQRFVGALFADS